MAVESPSTIPMTVEQQYAQAASAYCASLPLEHFMESTGQSTQRKITLESFDLICAVRPDVHIFSELLVQYGPVTAIMRVVPDNMVLIHDGEIEAHGSYDISLQAAHPFFVLEYVSPSNARKDYIDNMHRYERDLRVPYYMTFEPEIQLLKLFHLEAGKKGKGERYICVNPNAAGRFEVPELELEFAILDDWVRFWFRGELQPLPAELMKRLAASERRREQADQRADDEQRRRAQAEQRADDEQRRRTQADQRADDEQRRRESMAIELAQLKAENERLRKHSANGK